MEILEKISEKITNSDLSNLPNDLFDGKMGICIYFYHVSKFLSKNAYHKYADGLFLDICASVNNMSCINFDKGLSGIAWGILYLHRKNFIHGSLNEILHDFDNFIFRIVHFDWLEKKEMNRIDFMSVLFYYIERYPTIKNREERLLAEKTIIYLINYVDCNFSKESWLQPKEFNLSRNILTLYLLTLSRVYKLGIYKDKIIKICDSLSDTVLSTIPLSYANRTFFMLGLQNITSCVHIPEWEKYIHWLRSTINPEQIINTEFLNKEMSFGRGLAGYIWILSLLADTNLLTDTLRQSALKRIRESEVWMERFNPDSPFLIENIGFCNGFTGLAYVYYSLLNQ